jgi:hypothetical protein
MLEAVSFVEWLKLFAGIIVFLGPGFGLTSILYKNSLKNISHWFILSLIVSVCVCGIILAWLKLFALQINLIGLWVFFLSGWLIGLIYLTINRANIDRNRFYIRLPELLVWLISIAAGLIVLWSLRHQVAGLGSDSYHHTLITQLIFDNGGLPNNYQPATDQLISFSYHYGYHAAMATLMWLSGWGSRLLVLASTALLVMFSTFTSALLVDEVTERPYAGVAASAFTGFIFVFPMYMLNWGRYSQFAALILLSVFLQLIIAYIKKYTGSIEFRRIILLAIIAAGIAFTHYRVTIMAVLSIIFLIIFFKQNAKYSIHDNLRFLKPLLAISALAFLFFSPWLWQVIKSHQIGYSIQPADINSSYYSIKRLGVSVLNYPTNSLVIIFTISGLVWGFIKKKWFVLWSVAWAGSMLLLSGPYLFSGSMDRITVIISLYLPASVIVGWFTREIYSSVNKPLRKIVVGIFILIIIWSGYIALNKNLIGSSYVTLADLTAADWIKNNTPGNARFMVNTYKFDFSSNFVIGSDAGYWLPLLANRLTVTVPMIFNIEKFGNPDGLQQLLDFYNLGADITTPEAVDYLQKMNISYVFIGEHGGQIDVNNLLNSKDYFLVYQNNNVYLFKTKY